MGIFFNGELFPQKCCFKQNSILPFFHPSFSPSEGNNFVVAQHIKIPQNQRSQLVIRNPSPNRKKPQRHSGTVSTCYHSINASWYDRYCGYFEPNNAEQCLSVVYFKLYSKFRCCTSQQLLHELLSSCTSPSPTLWVCSCSVSTEHYNHSQFYFSWVHLPGKSHHMLPSLASLNCVLWSSGSFNITVFSFFLCCASGCWIFAIFLPSRLIIDYVLDSLWIEYFSFNFVPI